MIVWGGGLSSTFATNTGGQYDPALDTWTPTSTLNAPKGRQAHTAVWTGTEMIVWGGWYNDGATYHIVNSGGRYNPATDKWSPTTLANTPDARRWHSAVWTGREMIVWGGESGVSGGPINTGGRYNPSVDSWIATSNTNAPSPKIYHTAIWTGSEMIVWGGGPYSDTNTGGKYNPMTDRWVATNTNTQPRSGHTAVWTGTDMIVWGGDSAGVHVNTGARYNPRADAWTATSLSNAPDGRIAHAVTWTGDEMIVWGGYNYQQDRFLDSGGRYNPTTDSWTATTTVNAPGAAEFATAVWTGSRMIVWGGFLHFTDPFGHFQGYVLSTGGQYCAEASTASLLGNISTRTNVQTGDNIAIGGFVISGASGTSKTFLIRGIGPSLSQYGLNGVLQDPVLELHNSGGGTIATNNNWKDLQRTQILSTGLAPTDDREAAIYATLAAGSYTAVMRGNNNSTGVGLIQVYDISNGGALNLVNISTRAVVGNSDNVMIGGIIVSAPSGSATAALRILARTSGPTL